MFKYNKLLVTRSSIAVLQSIYSQFAKKLKSCFTWIAMAVAIVTTLLASRVMAQVNNNLPKDWQLGLIDPSSVIADEMYSFYNGILLYTCYIISILILVLLIYVLVRYREKRNPIPSKRTHNVLLETIWTIVPVIILIVIFIPSLKLIKLTDIIPESDLTIKVTGSQWYWSYEYPDYDEFSFQSVLVGEEEARKTGQINLMDVDNPLVLPVNKNVRLIITASDVLHAFGISSLGLKIDAVPGRLNETWVNITKEGVYYGFCYELCGSGHSYMPIKVVAVSEQEFTNWIEENKAVFAKVN